MFKHLKISTKLVVLSMSFALPIFVLLYFMISGHNYNIRFSMLEIYGNTYQRPLESLLKHIPEYKLSIKQENIEKSLSIIKIIDQKFDELREVHIRLGDDLQFTEEGLAARGRNHLLLPRVIENWNLIKSYDVKHIDSSQEKIDELTANIREMITHAGDTSNLILDPDLDSYYLMDVTLLALPQTQDRLATIIYYGAEALADQQLSPEEKLQFHVYATMLEEADYSRVLASIETSLNEDQNFYGISPSLSESVSPAVAEYKTANQALIQTLRDLAQSDTGMDVGTFMILGQKARESSFALWDVGADELDKLLMVRINDYKSKRLWSLVLTGMALAGALIMVFFLGRSITRPLSKIAEQSLKLAEGDYTITFKHEARDAIGFLTDAMNTIVEHTKKMLGEISSATQALAAASMELSSTSKNMTEGSNQTATMTAAVSKTTSEVTHNMTSVSAAMEQASINMTTVASAAEEMSATIHEIAQNSERARNTTANAVSKSKEACDRVDLLGSAAQEISAVTATITAISSQTNLLALNATIEASRAGSAGRGFAVVANEIKELAQQTARATEDIRERIAGIQSVTTQTVGDISEITNVVAEINEIVGSIAAAVEEQSVTTRDIAENVGQASTGITEINTNVAASSSMTQSISSDIAKVRTASDDMTVSSLTVQESATVLSQLAERLREQVALFKL
jgi:methyl-accepting chemotaxis protein